MYKHSSKLDSKFSCSRIYNAHRNTPILEQKRGRGISLPSFKLNARRGWLDNAMPRTLQPQGIRPGTQSREGLMGSRICLDGSEEEKLSCLTTV